MELKLISTDDGSHTLFHPELNESYHSSHGAIQESRHIFIESGFRHISPGLDQVNVLEVGFGTGLNALLTLIDTETQSRQVIYTAIEAFPLEAGTWSKLNYPGMLGPIDRAAIFSILHLASWIQTEIITNNFTLRKLQLKLQDYQPPQNFFDLVFFDAFSPAVQPELWTADIFSKIYASMKPGAVLTTYSVKGDVVRALKTAGFSIEKIPGPPGKRQITRATK
ncbi:MAG: tRNA (5-methylaminomethyl-2-thiouridine)(34)-methyltransferase MnmD [Bacteroidales bacterium]